MVNFHEVATDVLARISDSRCLSYPFSFSYQGVWNRRNASGVRPSGVTAAVTRCRLHHLPFNKLEEIEKEQPVLALNLYKMLSHLLAHREQITIEQLTTLHNIMSSPAHSKPLSRATLQAFSR